MTVNLVKISRQTRTALAYHSDVLPRARERTNSKTNKPKPPRPSAPENGMKRPLPWFRPGGSDMKIRVCRSSDVRSLNARASGASRFTPAPASRFEASRSSRRSPGSTPGELCCDPGTPTGSKASPEFRVSSPPIESTTRSRSPKPPVVSDIVSDEFVVDPLVPNVAVDDEVAAPWLVGGFGVVVEDRRLAAADVAGEVTVAGGAAEG